MCDYMCDLSIKPNQNEKGEPFNPPFITTYKWPLEDSNLQPKDYESSALPLS